MTDASWHDDIGAIREARPRHILFLCVANSARSQMAEGIARSMAPASVRISSAGSEPSRVRPQAIAALREIGLDISGHRSKGIEGVPDPPPDVVITLCAEEACPVWLTPAVRLHWPLPDPAGQEGGEGAAASAPEEEMEGYRRVRDELVERLGAVFG